ncbi:conjugal transfer pilus assembly protein TraB [Desulfacinum hydrothermale DSM 13146]|uniref:Conjugal transfer pilus assembly protein TraB n=1 Tax=Desulfacinum hydrothermale DSM 13146 TaxID=1121390 RepID=A0A1W1XVZ1_9BACT|nr:TraB/VirB10 family protein [Desulfacinum hydrothermale]SMC28103.1 conjugal transfer pilus assembly protein TraB [Desulfacinum hydrothermale DSM 13146]
MDFKEKWTNIPPTTRRKITLALMLCAIIGTSALITQINKTERTKTKTTSHLDTHVMVPQQRDATIEDLSGQLLNLEKRLKKIEQNTQRTKMPMLEKWEKRLTQLEQHRMGEDLESRIANIEKTLEKLMVEKAAKTQKPEEQLPIRKVQPQIPPIPEFRQNVPETTDTNDISKETVLPEVDRPQLRLISATDDDGRGSTAAEKHSAQTQDSLTQTRKASATSNGMGGGKTARDRRDDSIRKERAGKSQSVWIPAGALIQGVLLNGMDAPTSNYARKNPVPVILRIKHEAILPNRYRMDIRECFILASGYGVMSTERAELRTEKLSCVRQDGGVIETPIDGYLVGQDGKVGIRGRLVTKQGQMIAKSLIAGFFSGLSNAMSPSQITTLDITPGNTQDYQFPNPAPAAAQALLGGGSEAFGNVSQFYLDMAKELFPVVEIDAGRKATIIVINGTSVKLAPGNIGH